MIVSCFITALSRFEAVERLVSEFVDAVVEVGEDREEAVDEGVDDPVQQFGVVPETELYRQRPLSDARRPGVGS